MKTHIHFHSDCMFFAGCENMLANFFNDSDFMNEFNVTFSYRYSLAYEQGFKNRVNNKNFKIIPLKLFDIASVNNRIKFKPLKIMVKIFYRILLIKYWFVLWNTIVLYKTFIKEEVDLLHINNGGYPGANSCLAAVLAAKLLKINKIIFVVNNIAIPYNSFNRFIDYPLDKIVANSVPIFITGSDFAKQQLRKVLKLSKTNITNIYNGIKLRTITEEKQKVLNRLDIPDGRILIAVVAIMEERKGHIYLLKALQLLKKQEVDATLPIVLLEGTGPQLENLKDFVEKAELTKNVKFIGEERNVFNLLNAVDIVILPSIYNEDFPNVVLEAMGLGKTIIASRLSGTPEQIEHMESGILVEPRDIEGLAKAISNVISDQNLRKKFGENALNRFNENFLAATAVSNYKKLCLSLLEEEKV